jgi:DNA-binding Lrp family transcriptional regulator
MVERHLLVRPANTAQTPPSGWTIAHRHAQAATEKRIPVITAFLMVHCVPQRIHAVGQALAEIPGIAEVYTTTGDTDFIAIVRVPDLDALAELVTVRIAVLDGITQTDTHLAMRSYSRKEQAAAFDLGVD